MTIITIGNFEYNTANLIGNGAFALVYQGQMRNKPDQWVAVKAMRGGEKNLIKSKTLLSKEIAVLKDLNHSNIVRLFDHKITVDGVYLIMEFCNGGDLASYLQKLRTLPETTIQHFLIQLGSAMDTMHRQGIMHRDLKPGNILLCYPLDPRTRRPITDVPGTQIVFKLADFGFARFLQEGMMAITMCGSPMYMAPEVLMCWRYDALADIWSLGVIVYQCLTGKAPFYASNPESLKAIYVKTPNLRPKIPATTSANLTDLLLRMLVRNPKERINFKSLMNHAFLKKPPLLAPSATAAAANQSAAVIGLGGSAQPVSNLLTPHLQSAHHHTQQPVIGGAALQQPIPLHTAQTNTNAAVTHTYPHLPSSSAIANLQSEALFLRRPQIPTNQNANANAPALQSNLPPPLPSKIAAVTSTHNQTAAQSSAGGAVPFSLPPRGDTLNAAAALFAPPPHPTQNPVAASNSAANSAADKANDATAAPSTATLMMSSLASSSSSVTSNGALLHHQQQAQQQQENARRLFDAASGGSAKYSENLLVPNSSMASSSTNDAASASVGYANDVTCAAPADQVASPNTAVDMTSSSTRVDDKNSKLEPDKKRFFLEQPVCGGDGRPLIKGAASEVNLAASAAGSGAGVPVRIAANQQQKQKNNATGAAATSPKSGGGVPGAALDDSCVKEGHTNLSDNAAGRAPGAADAFRHLAFGGNADQHDFHVLTREQRCITAPGDISVMEDLADPYNQQLGGSFELEEPPELLEERMMDKEHNEEVCNLTMVLELCELISDLADHRASMLQQQYSAANQSSAPTSVPRRPAHKQAAANQNKDSTARGGAGVEARRIAEQMVLYRRVLHYLDIVFWQMKGSAHLHRLKPTRTARNRLQDCNNIYHRCYIRLRQLSREASAAGDGGGVEQQRAVRRWLAKASSNANRMIFEHALNQCSAAELDCLMADADMCLRRYKAALTLLLGVLQHSVSEKDQSKLSSCIQLIQQRYVQLWNNLIAGSPTETSCAAAAEQPPYLLPAQL